MQDVVNYLSKHYSEEALIALPCCGCPKRTRGRFRESAHGKTYNRPRCYGCSFEIALAALKGTSTAVYVTRSDEAADALPLAALVSAAQSNA